MNTIFFDVETGPLPESEIAAVMPVFDPAEVKCGNLKDPEKIAAKLAEAAANHQRDFVERAALDPLTGRVLAIGVLEFAGTPDIPHFRIIGHDDEAQVLREFWEVCRSEMGRIHQMVGFNIFQFDLPFLVRRSWKHRVEVPPGIRRGRYWANEMVDLREWWQLGERQSRGSLDSISKHLGVGTKGVPVAAGAPAGKAVAGADFARLWSTDREQSVAYLRNDVELTARVAGVLGLAPCACEELAY